MYCGTPSSVRSSFRLLSMCSPEDCRRRWSSVRAQCLAVFFLFSPIYALSEDSRSRVGAPGASEWEELKMTVSRLELLVEKNVEDLKSRFVLHQENDKRLKEMNSNIQYLQDSIFHTKKSQGASSCSEEKVNYLEEEIRKLRSEARQNNFDIHNLKSKANDAEEKLLSISSKVQEEFHKKPQMKDIVTEQWIQIRQLEQSFQSIKVRMSGIYRKSKPTECTFLKFIHGAHWQMDSLMGGYPSQVFNTFRTRHHELQGYVRWLLAKNRFTAAMANQEIIFFLASAVIILPFIAAYIMCFSNC